MRFQCSRGFSYNEYPTAAAHRLTAVAACVGRKPFYSNLPTKDGSQCIWPPILDVFVINDLPKACVARTSYTNDASAPHGGLVPLVSAITGPEDGSTRATEQRIIDAAKARGFSLSAAQFHWDAVGPDGGRHHEPIGMDIKIGLQWIKATWPRTALHAACSDSENCECVVIVRRIVGELR
jgi:hypothetical protein